MKMTPVFVTYCCITDHSASTTIYLLTVLQLRPGLIGDGLSPFHGPSTGEAQLGLKAQLSKWSHLRPSAGRSAGPVEGETLRGLACGLST